MALRTASCLRAKHRAPWFPLPTQLRPVRLLQHTQQKKRWNKSTWDCNATVGLSSRGPTGNGQKQKVRLQRITGANETGWK